MLVVDDFTDGREMVVEYLTFRGFNVFEAITGTEAIEFAQRFRPDVILMDLRMPGIDGWEATRQLKSDPKTRHIPVIAVTAHALRGAEKAAHEAGCDAFVSKPFDVRALGDMIVSAVRTHTAFLQSLTEETPLPPPPASPSARGHVQRTKTPIRNTDATPRRRRGRHRF